jgi:hypothetical protein
MAVERAVIEPRRRTTVGAAHGVMGTTPLPNDIQEQQCTRVTLLYAIGAAIWTIGLVMYRWVLPNPDKSVHGVVISGLAIAVCVLFLVYSRFSP